MVSLLNNASIEGVRMKEWKTRYKTIPKSLYPQYFSPFAGVPARERQRSSGCKCKVGGHLHCVIVF